MDVGTTWQVSSSHKHCKVCAKHAHAPPPRARTCLHDFHLVEFSHQPVPVQWNNNSKQQCDGAGETSRTTNYELQGTGWATRAPVAQTLQTVRQTCSCTTATCLYLFAYFHHLEFLHQPVPAQWNNELKQQGDGAGETFKRTKITLRSVLINSGTDYNIIQCFLQYYTVFSSSN